jgi:hypothetical protein
MTFNKISGLPYQTISGIKSIHICSRRDPIDERCRPTGSRKPGEAHSQISLEEWARNIQRGAEEHASMTVALDNTDNDSSIGPWRQIPNRQYGGSATRRYQLTIGQKSTHSLYIAIRSLSFPRRSPLPNSASTKNMDEDRRLD